MRLLVLLSALFLVDAAGADPLPADSSRESGRVGGYAGGGLAVGFEQWDLPTGLDGYIGNAYGFNMYMGYRALPWLAVEGAYEYLVGPDIDVLTVEAQGLTFTGNVRGYIPELTPTILGHEIGVQPYGLIGIGLGWVKIESDAVDVEESGTGFIARFGGGIDFYLVPQIALQVGAAYVLGTGDLDGSDFVSMNVGVHVPFR